MPKPLSVRLPAITNPASPGVSVTSASAMGTSVRPHAIASSPRTTLFITGVSFSGGKGQGTLIAGPVRPGPRQVELRLRGRLGGLLAVLGDERLDGGVGLGVVELLGRGLHEV